MPLDLPGDLYKYVADHVWHKLGLEVAKLTKEEYKECESVIDDLVRLKQQINNAPMKSDLRKDLIDELKTYRTKNEELIALAAAVFWHKIKDAKHKRKIVKR